MLYTQTILSSFATVNIAIHMLCNTRFSQEHFYLKKWRKNNFYFTIAWQLTYLNKTLNYLHKTIVTAARYLFAKNLFIQVMNL